MEKQAFDLLMNKLHGIDNRLSDGDKDFKDLKNTINKLHITIEKNTNKIAESLQNSKELDKKVETIKIELAETKVRVCKNEKFVNFFLPTKKKVAYAASVVSLLIGIITLKDSIRF